MDDPLPWVAVVSAALSGFFSLNGYALRNTSRRELEAAFAARPRRFRASLPEHSSELQMLCALLRTLLNLTLLVAMLAMFEASGPDIAGSIAAIAVTAGIVSIFAVAIPHAWANYAGAKVLAATAPILLALRWPL